tara:strand:+ start:340 stop:504 length:165 start_codon:yes stop_codon:yes gene_type:complete
MEQENLRDFFAGVFAAVLVLREGIHTSGDYKKYAESAYTMADHLITAKSSINLP